MFAMDEYSDTVYYCMSTCHSWVKQSSYFIACFHRDCGRSLIRGAYIHILWFINRKKTQKPKEIQEESKYECMGHQYPSSTIPVSHVKFFV